jgi:hypothetical protein
MRSCIPKSDLCLSHIFEAQLRREKNASTCKNHYPNMQKPLSEHAKTMIRTCRRLYVMKLLGTLYTKYIQE